MKIRYLQKLLREIITILKRCVHTAHLESCRTMSNTYSFIEDLKCDLAYAMGQPNAIPSAFTLQANLFLILTTTSECKVESASKELWTCSEVNRHADP